MYRVTKNFKILDLTELDRMSDPSIDHYAVVLYILKESSNIVANESTTLNGAVETAKLRESIDDVRREYSIAGKYIDVNVNYNDSTKTLTVIQDFNNEVTWNEYSARINPLFIIDISSNFIIAGKLESTIQFETI